MEPSNQELKDRIELLESQLQSVAEVVAGIDQVFKAFAEKSNLKVKLAVAEIETQQQRIESLHSELNHTAGVAYALAQVTCKGHQHGTNNMYTIQNAYPPVVSYPQVSKNMQDLHALVNAVEPKAEPAKVEIGKPMSLADLSAVLDLGSSSPLTALMGSPKSGKTALSKALIDHVLQVASEAKSQKFKPVWVGLDSSLTDDMTSMKVAIPEVKLKMPPWEFKFSDAVEPPDEVFKGTPINPADEG